MCGRADSDQILKVVSAALEVITQIALQGGLNLIKRTPTHIRNRFRDTLTEMEQNRSLYVKNPEKDFTRNGTFTLRQTMLFIMQMQSHSTNQELNNFFIPMNKHITQSAFVQAKGKLNEKAFPDLLHKLNKKFPLRKTTSGLHVFAIDGSDLNVPADKKDCSTFIPYNSKNNGYHQMHLNVLYDLNENRFADAVIQPRKHMREVDAACSLVDRSDTPGNCLFIFDRGYESMNLIAHVCERGSFFLIRAKDVCSPVSPFRLLELPDAEEFDSPIRFICTRSWKLKNENPVLYKCFQKKQRFDFIPQDDKTGTYELCFRLIKLTLDNGTTEYLITNLPKRKFPPRELKKLYNLRWGIEVAFLHTKYDVCLNFFHSINREFIIQEIFAKLIFHNFVSLIVSCTEVPAADTKYLYKIAFADAAYKCRCFLLRLKAYEDISTLLLLNLSPIRSGRSFDRNIQSQRLRPLQHRS